MALLAGAIPAARRAAQQAAGLAIQKGPFVGTLGIGAAGARNAALLAVAILANSRPELRERLRQFRAKQSEKVLRETLP